MNPNMVAAGTTVPSPMSPQMQNTPHQNTFEWVCAWVDNINLNSPEKSDDEIKDFLKARGYTSKRSLKYGILADPWQILPVSNPNGASPWYSLDT